MPSLAHTTSATAWLDAVRAENGTTSNCSGGRRGRERIEPPSVVADIGVVRVPRQRLAEGGSWFTLEVVPVELVVRHRSLDRVADNVDRQNRR